MTTPAPTEVDLSAVRRMTAALAVTSLSGFGILSFSFGVILAPMAAELGWSNAALSSGFTVGLIAAGAASAIVGRTIDMHGGRGVLAVGSFVGAAGMVLWALASSLPTYYLAWAVIGIGMAMSLYEPTFATVLRHAPGRRRESVLIITLAGALSSTIFIPLTELLVSRADWRTALLQLALLHVVLTLPGNVFLVPRGGRVLAPDEPVQSTAAGLAAAQATRAPTLATSSDLRRAAVSMVLGHAPIIAIGTHLVTFLVLGGRSPATAAALAGGVGLGKLVGRLGCGVAVRRYSSYRLLNLCYLTMGLALHIPLLLPPGPLDVAMIALFGLGAGALTVLRPLYIAELFGAVGFGETSGRINRVNKIATAFVPMFVGLIVTGTGSYRTAWFLLAICEGLAIWLLPKLPAAPVPSATPATSTG